jgi:hypothetical protein
MELLVWVYLMELLGNVGQMEAHLVHLEVLLTSTQDSYVVGAKHTIGSEISLAARFEPNVPHHENIFGYSRWSS